MQLVLPALTFRHPDGQVDAAATVRYARRAADTWTHLFILSGTTTGGHHATTAERAAVVDIWAEVVGTDRITACCWTADDITAAQHRRVIPMVAMQNLDNERQALDFLTSLPRPSYVFSHPEYSRATFTPRLAAAAVTARVLPAGAKVSKIRPDRLTELRAATSTAFTLWDGTARHIAASLTAGADGIVTAPLSHLPAPFPRPQAAEVQRAVDATQSRLDELTNRDARTDALFELARRAAGTIK